MTEMANKAELATAKPQPIGVFGSDDNVGGLVRRMRFMIPGAADSPDAIVWKAAQLATIHKLDPFSGDVWVYPAYQGCKPEEWVVDVGVSAWRRAAQRQAKYTCAFEQLTDTEAAARIGEDYTSEDVGVKCTLYRLDVARECKELGIPYEPVITYGFWRKQARYIKSRNTWIPDQLANTETREDKAKKRAEKKALKIAFSLDFPDDQPAMGEWRVADLERQVEREERARLPVTQKQLVTEEDGDVIYA